MRGRWDYLLARRLARALLWRAQWIAGRAMKAGDRVVLLEDPLGVGVGVIREAWHLVLVEWTSPQDGQTTERWHDPFELELESVWLRSTQLTDDRLDQWRAGAA